MADKVRMNGREYTFTPGKNGSLLYQGKPPVPDFISPDPQRKRAKVISSPQATDKFTLRTVNGKQVYDR